MRLEKCIGSVLVLAWVFSCQTQEPTEDSLVGDPRLLERAWDGGPRDLALSLDAEADASETADASADDASAPDRAGVDADTPADGGGGDQDALDAAAELDSSVADLGWPDAAPQPDTSSPDQARPDTSAPDLARPDTSAPDLARPDTTSADAQTNACETDAACDDGKLCNGREACSYNIQLGYKVCRPGVPLECAPSDLCHSADCDDATGCFELLIDEDGDGYASDTLGACGVDCDDTRDDVNPLAAELCDDVDHDCDGSPDPRDPPLWYKDCDKDGFAVADAQTLAMCADPGNIIDCGWTRLKPADDASIDCYDYNKNMFPGQTTFFTTPHDQSAVGDDARFGNYDCDGRATYELARVSGVSTTAPCDIKVVKGRDGYAATCVGDEGWTGRAVPACGNGANYTQCPEPATCSLGVERCEAAGFTAVCVGAAERPGDPCFCLSRCTPDCVPGERDCPWVYVSCTREVLVETFMGCR